MGVEKDIKYALNIINGKIINKNYRPINFFPNRSLKTLKKFKISDKNVLTKLTSISEILDIASYNGKINCYSTNKLDKYFLVLIKEFLKLDYKEFKNLIFNSNDRSFYNQIKKYLDDETRMFFDEIYSKTRKNILETKLCDTSKIDYNIICNYVRYLLNFGYYDVQKNLQQINYKYCSDNNILSYFNDQYDFINLSYNIDNLEKEKMEYILKKVKEIFFQVLSDNGKIQLFVGNKLIDIENLKRIEVKSLNEQMEKDYAYIYRKISS